MVYFCAKFLNNTIYIYIYIYTDTYEYTQILSEAHMGGRECLPPPRWVRGGVLCLPAKLMEFSPLPFYEICQFHLWILFVPWSLNIPIRIDVYCAYQYIEIYILLVTVDLYFFTTSVGETNILIFQSGLFSQRYIYIYSIYSRN